MVDGDLHSQDEVILLCFLVASSFADLTRSQIIQIHLLDTGSTL